MSNPPFDDQNPFHSDDDFSFPIEDFITNQITQDEDDHILPCISSLPISQFDQDYLSMFLDDNHHEETLHDDPPITTTTTKTKTKTTMMIDEYQVRAANNLNLEGGEGSCSTNNKKLNHNAKERVRRMKLNDTFLALRALLPQSRRPKKRWSAPYVIDRALEYIPELQTDIDKLTLEKDNMLSVIQNKQQQQQQQAEDDDQHYQPHNNNSSSSSSTLTVSINQVNDDEFILQICEDKDKVGVLTTLIDKLEEADQGGRIMVLGASSLCASQHRSCFHIHIQISKNAQESDFVANLHKKIISWLS